MKVTICYCMLLVMVGANGCSTWDPGQYGPNRNKREYSALIEEIERADHQLNVHPNGKVDIGIGMFDGQVFEPRLFTFEELSSFYRAQTHKNLVVVTFHKRSERVPRDELENIVKFFQERSYERLLIVKASAFGIIVVADTVLGISP